MNPHVRAEEAPVRPGTSVIWGIRECNMRNAILTLDHLEFGAGELMIFRMRGSMIDLDDDKHYL